MRFTFCLISFVFLGFRIVVFSQNKQNITFEHISLEQGLSQSTVNSIIQDRFGFLWFATFDGLNKYDGYSIQIYRNQNDSISIPDNSINTLFEDANGRIWLGINNGGLSYYDVVKNRFHLYKSIPNNKNSLSNNNVKSISQDKYGTIWIGTTNGLTSFDFKTQKFEQYFKSLNKLTDNKINKVLGDKFGNVWVATDNGLVRIISKNKQFISYDIKLSELSSNVINNLYIDKNNILWIATNNGINWLDLKLLSTTECPLPSFKNFKLANNIARQIIGKKITGLLLDIEDNLWIGTENDGLFYVNALTGEGMRFYHKPQDNTSLSVNGILSVLEDNGGNIWIGTALGGVNKFNRAAKPFLIVQNNPNERNSLINNQVRTVFEDSEGFIWIGTRYGGLDKWDIDKNQFTHYQYDSLNRQSIRDNYVRCILEDKDKQFWIGTDTAGLARFDKRTGKFIHYKHNPNDSTSLGHNQVWKILQDSKGRIWVCTFGGGLNLFDPVKGKFTRFVNIPGNSNSLADNEVISIFEDSKQRIWVGTYDGGLHLFNAVTKNFVRYPQKSLKNDQQFVDRIYSIFEDSKKQLWITARGSVNKFDPETGIFTKYSFKEFGFPNHVLMSITADEQGNFWIPTNFGLSRFNPATLKVRNFFESDGLQSNEFMIGANLKTRKGLLIFGGINGLNLFYPREIKDNRHQPEIVITSFSIKNQIPELDSAIQVKKQVQLHHTQNVFSIEFIALDYGYPDKNIYAYKLVGFDKDWVYSNTRHFAMYTNLDPGTYIFKVKGANNDGVWNETGTSLIIVIEPPFWRTTWFYFIVFVFIVAIIILVLKMRDVFRDKRKLSTLVQKRTATIMQQKEEIEAQLEQIENQKNRLQQAYKNIKVLSEIGQLITAQLKIEDIIDTLFEQLNAFVEADDLEVGLYNQDKKRIDFVKSYSYGRVVPAKQIDLNCLNNLPAWSFINKKEALINNYTLEIAQYIPDISVTDIESEKSKSMICEPLFSNEGITGIIVVKCDLPNKYTNYHSGIIKNLSVYVSIAFSNANAYKQLHIQQKGITDSIHYAHRIQRAILPPDEMIESVFADYFILYKPRDIVSGDFYWFNKIERNNENKIIIAAADCTGHGVPGAVMSMLGVSLLNEIVNNLERTNEPVLASDILNQLRESVIRSLHQTGRIGEAQDGMDIALCIIDYSEMKLQYAGANNPLYYFSEQADEFKDIKPDRMPIGIFLGKMKPFNNNVIDINKGDSLYIFTDGYIDQFGGPEGKKYYANQLKMQLSKIYFKKMAEQKELLNSDIQQWMNFNDKNGKKYEQIDDILMIGIRI